MRANAKASPVRNRRARLLAAAGLAALACGGTAQAQVAATPVFVQAGGGSTVNSNHITKTTTVTLTGMDSQSIINWVPNDTAPTGGTIDVLPGDSIWNFNGLGNYVVLNRFVNGAYGSLSRQIAISGTVNSFNLDTSATQRGSIWFYNAGGLLINSGAAIDVGSLVLTSSDIDTSGTPGTNLFGPGGAIRFHGPSPSASGVTIAQGAAITVANPLDPGSAYLAIVAPRIRQSGAVRIDGSAAYVAAEAADIHINLGMFDIDVLTGTDGAGALVHDGSTTGPAHEQGDIHQSRIYMVAIPRNDAVSMLVSGQVGYDDALTAQSDPDGTVILSGGYGILGGQIADGSAPVGIADIAITDIRLRSDTQARASGAFTATATGAAFSGPSAEGQIFVEGSARFGGDASAALTLEADQFGGANGDFLLESRGGTASMAVDGGQFQVRGNIVVSADAGGGTINDPDGADVQGGTATIRLSGGAISADSITASASGFGGVGITGDDFVPATPLPGGDGGAGRGGRADILIDGTADVTATGGIAAYAIGEGGEGGNFESISGISGAVGSGGEGRGGTASVTVDLAGGTIAADSLTVDASGVGGEGGAFVLLTSSASAGGGIGGRGGDGYGGAATMNLATPVATSSRKRVVAQAIGGTGGSHDSGGGGGNATGGNAQAFITGFDAGDRPIDLVAGAEGGEGGDGQDGAGGNGGHATGGTARMQAEGASGRIIVAASNFRTQGTGGRGGDGGLSPFAADVLVAPSGGRGGNGTGGIVEAVASNGATLILSAENSAPSAFLGSPGVGGNGGTGSANFSGAGGIGGHGGDGGAGSGGAVRLIADGGTVSRGSGLLSITVNGFAGLPGAGGDGTGGMGAAGAGADRSGGQILIDANDGPATAGLVELGEAILDADGDEAGRVVLRGGGAIRAVSLDARARGTAAPTNGDVDTAAAGLFLAPIGAGSIETTGAMQLRTDGSIGIHSAGGGGVAAGGPATLEAGDQVDIRHIARTDGTATLRSANNLSITAATSIDAQPDSLLSAGAALTLTTTGTGSDIAVGRLDAATIAVTASGAASVEQAAATGDFTASAASIRTGRNTAGGDITLTAPGAVDLGHSSAGGLVSVTGQSIAFASIDAGTSVALTSSGAGAITGGLIDAASVTITTNGAAAIDDLATTGHVAINAASIRTGRNIAGGNIILTASGAVDLGDSSAGGLLSVDGQSIAFASIDADTSVALNASGTGGVTGGSIDAASLAIMTNGAAAIDEIGTVGNVAINAASIRTGRNAAGGDIILTAPGAIDLGHSSAGGLVSADGQSILFTRIDAGADLTLNAGGGGIAGGTIDAGANVAITASGAAVIDHADAIGHFTASAASFRTGPNSIITGGDILITSPGLVDLGNSSAGGLVSVNGLSILFDSIAAGTTLGLNASGPDGIEGGALDAGGDILLTASRIALTGPVTGDASLAAYATGGPAAIGSSNVAGNITVIADGDIGGAYVAGGDIRLDSGADIAASAIANGGYIDANSIMADGNLFITADGNAALTNARAARMVGVRAGQAAVIASGSAGEDLLLLGGTTASLTGFSAGDDIRVEAAGAVAAQNVTTTGLGADTADVAWSPTSGFAIVTAAGTDGADIHLGSTGGAIGGANVTAAGDLTGEAATGITGGAFSAQDSLALTAGTAIGIAGAQGGTVALTGTAGVTAGTVASGGATTLLSGGGAIAIDDLSSVGDIIATANSVRVSDGGDLRFASLVAETGDAAVHSSGDLTVVSGQVAGTADLSSGGSALTVTSLEAADAALTAANGTMTLGDITIARALDAQAFGALAIGGDVTGETIALTSGDIAIGGAGHVRAAGAAPSIRIANGNNAQQSFVGGTGTRTGYHIDADELSRLSGGAITISGAGFSGGPDVVVDGFTLTGGAAGSNLGPDGSLTIRAQGDMRLLGDVLLTGLSDANRLSLSARDNIDIMLGEATVRLLNASGAPGGLLAIEASQTAVATPQAIADIASAPDLSAIEARLARNDGMILDEGSLFARGIRFDGDVYVQNSGGGTAYPQRRGLTFGAGGLDVSANGAARIVLNGVHLGNDGQVTGLDAMPLLTIRGGPAGGAAIHFDAQSTFNGCLIANPTACIAAMNGGTRFPVQDVIEEPGGIEGGEDDAGDGIALPTALITLRALDPLTGEPLVDDPVTGAGNDDLWTPPGA